MCDTTPPDHSALIRVIRVICGLSLPNALKHAVAHVVQPFPELQRVDAGLSAQIQAVPVLHLRPANQ